METEKTEPPIDMEAVKSEYQEQLKKVMASKFTPEQIQKDVHTRLERERVGIVASLLGFEFDCGHFSRVDHCNGRAGESAAGDFLRSVAGRETMKWLEKQAGELPELPESAIQSLRKDYIKTFEERLRYQLKKNAEEKADEFAKSITEQCLREVVGDEAQSV